MIKSEVKVSLNVNKITVFMTTICSGLITLGLVSTTVSALEYQSNPVDIKFEFGSTLNITTGGNISISDLTPGTKAISASNYNVTVSTNNLTGYTLSATVGCSSGTDCYDSKNLSDGTNTFSMLSADGALTAGTWGVSLDSSATANSNFKTLAKYDETATIINKTTNNTGTPATGYTGTANTTVRVGAYATNSQVAGTYTNSINFIAVANVLPEPHRYMQEQTQASLAELMPNVGDETTLYDSRDEKSYTVAKLADGYYWMTQNLRLGKGNGEIIALDSSNSDLPSGTTFNLKASGMGSNQPDATGDCNVGNWYPGNDDETETNTSHLCINTSDTETYGVYYNWYTATAGTGTYSVTSGEAAGSICPKGWILPPNSGERSYYNLLFTKGGLSNNAASATAMQTTPYNFPLSGYSYGEGIYYVGSYGAFWSSTARNVYYAYRLYFYSSRVGPQAYVNKGFGSSVRCVFGS